MQEDEKKRERQEVYFVAIRSCIIKIMRGKSKGQNIFSRKVFKAKAGITICIICLYIHILLAMVIGSTRRLRPCRKFPRTTRLVGGG